jgi:hypothetical protein
MLYFNQFCELIHCYEDVCESTLAFLEWTYQIQTHVEKGQVIGMATFATMDQGVSV